mgnify:CR=1 FL=1
MQKECRAIVEKCNTKAAESVGKNQRNLLGTGHSCHILSERKYLAYCCLSVSGNRMARTVVCQAARNAEDDCVFRISGLFSGVCGTGMVAGCAEPHAGADRLASLFPELSVGTSHAVCRRDHDTGQCGRRSFIYGYFGKSICEYGSAGKQQCDFCLLRSVYMPVTKVRVVCFMQV